MNKTVALLILFLGPWAATGLGFAASQAWLLPLLCAFPAYPAFRFFLGKEQIRATYVWMTVWALMQTAALALFAWYLPDKGHQVVWQGTAYSQEMLHWIRTGIGPEGDPSLYLPIHAWHLLLFCALCLVSYGFLGLVLGSALLNYMNFYVVELVRVSLDPVQAGAIGWPVWAVLRVLGFMALAIGFALAGRALLHRLKGLSPVAVPRGPFLWGFALVVLDASLKAVLAPTWRTWLLDALGL